MMTHQQMMKTGLAFSSSRKFGIFSSERFLIRLRTSNERCGCPRFSTVSRPVMDGTPALSLPTSIRMFDLDSTGQMVKSSAALRIMDHHLHISGLLTFPSAYQDAYCMGQAVTTFPTARLIQDGGNPSTTANGEIQCHVWVSDTKPGLPAIGFGSAITIKDYCVALSHRVFVRIDRATRKPIRLTREEVAGILQAHPQDPTGQKRFQQAIPKFRKLRPTFHVGSSTNNLLTVSIGPQHVNCGYHVDHSFLAETALHALSMSSSEDVQGPSELRVQYIQAPSCNMQDISCSVSKNTYGTPVVSLWGTNHKGEEGQLLVLAQMESAAMKTQYICPHK